MLDVEYCIYPTLVVSYVSLYDYSMDPPDSPTSPLEGTTPSEVLANLEETLRSLQISNRLLRIHNTALLRQVEVHRRGERWMSEAVEDYRDRFSQVLQLLAETHTITLETLAGLRDPTNLEPIGATSVPWTDGTEEGTNVEEEAGDETESEEDGEDPSSQAEPEPLENGWLNHSESEESDHET